MEIRNEVKPPKDKEVEKKKFVVRNAADIQRAKLEKLMKNPDKPVVIPAPSRNRDFSNAIPTFVRNVMGSSAGAGSGEFHVYRHLRRKEYARQKQIQEKSHAEHLDEAFQDKLEQNRQTAEERTAKKRAKRQKKKAKQKANQGKKPKLNKGESDGPSSSSDGSDEEGNTESQGEKVTDPDKTTEELTSNANTEKVIEKPSSPVDNPNPLAQKEAKIERETEEIKNQQTEDKNEESKNTEQ